MCRKRTSIVETRSLTDAAAAAQAAERRLSALIAAGVAVGAGDIRSVIRGQVLATYTADPQAVDLESCALEADELATERVNRLLGLERKISS